MSSNALSIRYLQELMSRTYLHKDAKRGADRTLLWMCSELGEVVDSYVKSNLAALRIELADLLAWMLSFCNLTGIDLEDAFLSRYGNGCPKCRKSVCECPER